MAERKFLLCIHSFRRRRAIYFMHKKFDVIKISYSHIMLRPRIFLCGVTPRIIRRGSLHVSPLFAASAQAAVKCVLLTAVVSPSNVPRMFEMSPHSDSVPGFSYSSTFSSIRQFSAWTGCVRGLIERCVKIVIRSNEAVCSNPDVIFILSIMTGFVW